MAKGIKYIIPRRVIDLPCTADLLGGFSGISDFLPLMKFSYLLQQVYSISDAAIVGQTLTASEVAGVNDTTSLAMIFLQFAFGASAGFCTVTSCFVGARDSAGVRRSMATQIVLSAALTAVLTALALALLDPMLAWINVTPASGLLRWSYPKSSKDCRRTSLHQW